MALSLNRWILVSPSEYQWERDALDYIRENLPDSESYRAWTNFEFLADDGSINEVDLLIVTPAGFFLVEIKSRPGSLSGDASTWFWKKGKSEQTIDNPLWLANRKSKKLISLLKRQKAAQKARLPFLEPLIFCSAKDLQFHLSGVAANHICLHEKSPYAAGRKIMDALQNGRYPGARGHLATAIDRPMIRTLSKAIEEAGIKPTQRSRRVGDYQLGALLYESQSGAYQDWAAAHVSSPSTERRIRIYNIARKNSDLDREYIRRAANREFQLLDPIEHAGVLRVIDFTDHELGPAVIMQHFPDAVRLDHFLAQYGETLTPDLRLNLTRQIAETLRYAHKKRLVHRALSPQSVLVLDAETRDRFAQDQDLQLADRISDGREHDSRVAGADFPSGTAHRGRFDGVPRARGH
jgi:hypothetical protein